MPKLSDFLTDMKNSDKKVMISEKQLRESAQMLDELERVAKDKDKTSKAKVEDYIDAVIEAIGFSGKLLEVL